MATKSHIPKKESDTPLPNEDYTSANVEVSPTKQTSCSADASTITIFDRTIVIHDANAETVGMTFNVELERKRRSNLIANRGPEPSKPSSGEK
jgi:ribosomal protein S10